MRSVMLLECLLFVAAAPPTIDVPKDLKPVSGYVRFTPGGDAKTITYYALGEAYPFPSDELKDPRRFILPVVGLKDGTYRFVAFGSKDDEHTVVEFSVVIGKPTTPPDKPPEPPVEPPPDKPPVTGKYYFLVVRPNGPASAEFAKTFADPAWDELRKAGHTVKEMTVQDSLTFYRPADGQGIPFVVTLTTGQTPGKVLAGPVPMPKTPEAIRELPKGVK